MGQFAIGVGVGVAVGLAIPYLTHYLPFPGRRARVERTIARAKADHDIWVERREQALVDDIVRIENDMLERGILGSSIQTESQKRAKKDYERDVLEHEKQRDRQIEDAVAELGPLEHRRLHTT